MIKQEPTVAVPAAVHGSALPAFQEYSGVIIRLCGGGKNCCRKSQALGIFITLQRRWDCVHTAESSQVLHLGVVHVCLPEKPSVYGLFSLGSVVLFPLQH